MINSMTAFARVTGTGDWSHTVWEVRSVNHRYLEITVRLPDELRGLEAAVRERVSQVLQRGKVECILRYTPVISSTADLSINYALIRQVGKACQEISTLISNTGSVNPLAILNWPGVLNNNTFDLEDLSGPILAILDKSLKSLVEARQREGLALKVVIEERCTNARIHVARLRERQPEIIAALKERLKQRALELAVTLDENRLEQEILLLAQKMDVAEELDRLETHLDEIKRLISQPGAVGRRLDFLLQELNREANTIASKSCNSETTGISIELKVLIEQMREQVQNIE